MKTDLNNIVQEKVMKVLVDNNLVPRNDASSDGEKAEAPPTAESPVERELGARKKDKKKKKDKKNNTVENQDNVNNEEGILYDNMDKIPKHQINKGLKNKFGPETWSEVSDSEENEKIEEVNTWAKKTSITSKKKVDTEAKEPPMINLENLLKKKNVYNSRKEEVEDKFNDARNWLGLVMDIEDIRRYTWSYKVKESDQTILNAHCYNDNRLEAITAKLEQSAWINKRQITIQEYYFTTAGGLIAWVKLGKVLVDLIHSRAITASSRNFRTITFTPKLARNRRTSLDKILLEYKKKDSDFRFIIRNGTDDLTVLVKRISEHQHIPYRKYDLHNLGAISPLKPDTPVSEEDRLDEAAGSSSTDGYIPPKSGRRDFLAKDEIFNRLKGFLDGFKAQDDQNKTRVNQAQS